jgi:LAO/AO transport system kinase|tara:strand:- start:7116 stop:8129 length:1014 start_codon:yes stop_codon:yes gene_type:complete
MAVRPNISIKKREVLSAQEIFKNLIEGKREWLSKALTLVESTRPEHRKTAKELVQLATPFSGKSIRIGITGVPGVGKSTFIESFGLEAILKGKKVCVLAIDPSSEISKGSLLGDKTRMDQLSTHSNAYIRPSPTSGTLGGVTRATRESILLCESAGYDLILIETVGVGQSETKVHSMVDAFLMLLLSNAGDEIQGIKRGIMEMADILVVNKADGENQRNAKIAAHQLQQALHYFPLGKSGWAPSVSTMSALNNEGVSDIWKKCTEYIDHIKSNKFFEQNRKLQAVNWFKQSLSEQIIQRIEQDEEYKKKLSEIEEKVAIGKLDPFIAADLITDFYFR